MSTSLSASLEIALTTASGRSVNATLCGQENRLDLLVDDPGAFAGRDDAPRVRALADFLAHQGVVVRVLHGERELVSLGAVIAPLWQRRMTGSRHIRLGSLRGAWTSLRARVGDREALLPDEGLAPPATPWPPAPTFARRNRRPVGTTHDPARGGGARLVLTQERVGLDERPKTFWLQSDVTLIGSSTACEIVFPGLESVHAWVEHDQDDEFVLVCPGSRAKVHGAPVERALLRTGTRVELGPWTLAFVREEWADHGRPYGGRLGGEVGHQKPQPPRTAVQQGL